MLIGELANKTKVSIDTIRYYERVRLIPKPERLESGYRVYNEQAVTRLRFVKQAKILGFSLKEIMELLDISKNQESDCGDTCQKLDEKILDINQRIKDLTTIKTALVELRKDCPGRGYSLDECVMFKCFYESDNHD